jgi:hypothetical protein
MRTLQIEPAQRGRAHGEQREALLVVHVDQLVGDRLDCCIPF